MAATTVFKKIPEELDDFTGELVVAVIGEDERPLRASNAWLDWRLYGTLQDLLVRQLFLGRLGEKCLVPSYGKFGFDRVVLLGAGPLNQESARPTTTAGQARWNDIATVVRETVSRLSLRSVGLSLPRWDDLEDERRMVQAFTQVGLTMPASFFVARAHPSHAKSRFV